MDFIIKDAVPVSLHYDFSRTSERAGSGVPFDCISYLHHVFLCHGDAQLDCLCSCVFFLRNEAMRNQSYGSNSMSHGLVPQRNALVFEISVPVCISGMLDEQNVTSRVALCL